MYTFVGAAAIISRHKNGFPTGAADEVGKATAEIDSTLNADHWKQPDEVERAGGERVGAVP